MRVLSNAFLDQAEIIQNDPVTKHPLELFFVGDKAGPRTGMTDQEMRDELAIGDWNRRYEAGFLRDAETMARVEQWLPRIAQERNPNIALVPRVEGFSELHSMLVSVLPDGIAARHGLRKIRSEFGLTPAGLHLFDAAMSDEAYRDALRRYATAARKAFEEYIWTWMTGSKRAQRSHFHHKTSSLRLLAGDVTFWMTRLYGIARKRRATFGLVTHEDPRWEPLATLTKRLHDELPPEDRTKYRLQRPRLGGELWNAEDERERASILDELVRGEEDSLAPVIQLLIEQPTHEDFSDRYSWIKEDFERSFYSKRAKVKITMIETIDECPVWIDGESAANERLVLRDLFAAVNPKDRRILLALRQGRTVAEIAADHNYKGHAHISRRVKEIQARVGPLLGVMTRATPKGK